MAQKDVIVVVQRDALPKEKENLDILLVSTTGAQPVKVYRDIEMVKAVFGPDGPCPNSKVVRKATTLLNQGKIVVGGTLSEIKALHGHESLLLEFPTDDALHTFKSQEAIQPLLDTAEANGKEIILHSQEMEKVQHTVFHVLAETALCPIKIEIMEPSLESLFLEVIK